MKKLPFKQSEWDRLVTRKAKATLELRKARAAVDNYARTHTSGIARKPRGAGDSYWV